MNMDQAVGVLYAVVGKCDKNSPDFLEALQALAVLEHSVEALHNSHKLLCLLMSGDFIDEDEAGQLHKVVSENEKVLALT